ncbi:fimbrial protein [Serratia aquatilis]|uniref:Fimbrial protein n=1 Tax=Serratia aquatilis TaxID=1737515 RepID=A0ABV6EBA6_9GAMM
MDLKNVFKNAALCLALASMGASFTTLAAGATLTIKGTIKASPCVVDADDAAGNVSVNLGDSIEANTLAAPNRFSDWKDFTLHLKDCPDATTQAVATFSGTQATETGAANMYKNTGTAGKVQIELQDSRGGGTRQGNSSTMMVPVTLATHDATFPMRARAYTVEGGVTPGTILGVVQVAFTYQ